VLHGIFCYAANLKLCRLSWTSFIHIKAFLFDRAVQNPHYCEIDIRPGITIAVVLVVVVDFNALNQ
jgi:hypothetical protein